MNEVVVSTPRYVLMDGNRRLGPQVISLELGAECLVIYGFSDKGRYDRFCVNSDLALTPYPLVPGYLRSQAGDSGGPLKLVALDAEGPRQRCLHAATMKEVLEAQENRIAQLTSTYQLVFDQQADAYRLDVAPSLSVESGT